MAGEVVPGDVVLQIFCSESRILCRHRNDVVLQMPHICAASRTVLRSTKQRMRSSQVDRGLSVCSSAVPVEAQKVRRQLGQKYRCAPFPAWPCRRGLAWQCGQRTASAGVPSEAGAGAGGVSASPPGVASACARNAFLSSSESDWK